MKKRITVLCTLTALLVAAVPPAAEAKVLTIYPHQVKDWVTRTDSFFQFDAVGISSPNQVEFMFPVRLPVGARVTQLKAWAIDAAGSSWVRLIRSRDGFSYSNPADNLAEIDLNDGDLGVWTLLADTTEDGPAPARIVAGYRYYILVHIQADHAGTIQVVYTTP